MSDHPIPSWRPGAVYWRPLDDGRELTVYPQLPGTGLLCLGPLADPIGYDQAWRYPETEDAVRAARAWEDMRSEPPGKWVVREGRGGHGGSGAKPVRYPEVGQLTEIMPGDEYEYWMDASSPVRQVRIKRQDDTKAVIHSIEGYVERLADGHKPMIRVKSHASVGIEHL